MAPTVAPVARSLLDPERLTRYASALIVVLAAGLLASGWQYRRAALSVRASALASAEATALGLASEYKARVESAVWQPLLEAFVPAFVPDPNDLSRTVEAMRARGAAWIAGCACRVPEVGHFLVFDVEGARAAWSAGVGGASAGVEGGAGRPPDDEARRTRVLDHLRRFARSAPNDVRRFHMLVLSDGASTQMAHLRVVRDANGRRVGAAALIPASALGATVLEPLRQDLVARLYPAIPGRDSVAGLTVRLRDGTPLYASSWGGAGISARVGLWVPADSSLTLELTLNPAVMHLTVPGWHRAPNDTLLALAAGLLVAVSLAGLVLLSHARRLMRTRTLFLTGVSHELRTPLTQVLMYAELLERPDLDGTRRHKAQQVILRESRRLVHMIENVLLFARGGSRLPLNPRPVSLATVVRDVVEDLGALLARHGAGIATSLDEEAWAMADVGAVRQVLVNLVDNALRYGPRGQTVRIAVERQADRASLVVTDEGPGIPPDRRDEAWRPFVRLHPTGEGTGIGLSLVRQLAEAMGGGARFLERPAPCRGLSVLVWLPLANANVRPVAVHAGDDAPLTVSRAERPAAAPGAGVAP
jgi:signal transduction histidine kinase